MDEDPKMSVLTWLQSAHTILGTARSRPDHPSTGGSRVFLGTKLFAALQTCANKIDTLMQEENEEFRRLWAGVCDVIAQLARLARSSTNPDIDSAFNLMYLATGVIFHRLAEKHPESYTESPRFDPVRQIDVLAAECAWPGPLDNIVYDLTSALFRLKLTCTTRQ